MRLISLSSIIFLLCSSLALGDMLENFEDQNVVCSDANWTYDVYSGEGDLGSITIVSGGAAGTDYCGRTSILPDSNPTSDGDHCSTQHSDGYYYGRNYTDIDDVLGAINQQYMSSLAGSSRLSFWLKLPSDFPQVTGEATAANFHVGTYQTYPDGYLYSNSASSYYGTAGAGYHPYHWFNIKPSTGGHWTRCIANKHPQHITSVSGDPGNDPYNYDYWMVNRLYWETYPCWPVDSEAYYFYLDEIEGITDTEPQDDTYITGLYVTYHGSGSFTVGWNGSTMYADISDTFDVYFSASPLTNANYSTSGTLANDDLAETGYGYDISNYYETTISTGITTGTVYFAIKCNNVSAPAYVSKIDYPLTSPSVTPTLSNGIRLKGVLQGIMRSQ